MKNPDEPNKTKPLSAIFSAEEKAQLEECIFSNLDQYPDLLYRLRPRQSEIETETDGLLLLFPEIFVHLEHIEKMLRSDESTTRSFE